MSTSNHQYSNVDPAARQRPAIVHAPDYPAPYGGNFMAALTTLAGLCAEHGYRTVMALPEAARSKPWCAALAAGGLPLCFLPDRASTFQYARQLAAIARAEGAVLLHTHFTTYDVAARLAKLMLRLRGQRLQIVWHAHSELRGPSLPKQPLKKWIKYRLFGSAARMIAVSDSVAADLLAVGAPKAAVRVVPNGIDLRGPQRPAGRGPSCSRRWGWTMAGRCCCCSVGSRFARGSTWPATWRRPWPGRAAISFWGPSGRKSFGSMPKHCAAGRSLPWLRLLAPQENVADLYQAAAAFLSPSRSEGLPYSVCEAMANGIPVVLSDIPSMAFAHRSPGAVFAAPGDSRSLAEAVRSVLGWTPDQRQDRCQANRDLVRGEFDVQVWARRVFQIYQDILPGKN